MLLIYSFFFMIEVHHTIPLSLCGTDEGANKIPLDKDEHRELHRTQKIPFWRLRLYRARTNWILIPTEKTLDLKFNLWRAYFKNAVIAVEEQKASLRQQSWNYYLNDFDDLLFEIIENQKNEVFNVLNPDYGI